MGENLTLLSSISAYECLSVSCAHFTIILYHSQHDARCLAAGTYVNPALCTASLAERNQKPSLMILYVSCSNQLFAIHSFLSLVSYYVYFNAVQLCQTNINDINYKCWFRNLVDTSGVYGLVYLGLLSSNIATHGHIWHNAKPTQSCGMSSNIEAGSSFFGQSEAVLVFRGRCFRLTCTFPVNPVSAILTRPLT